MTTSYPRLEYLFGGYFNQDWSIDRPTAEGIMAFFVESESPEVVRATVKEFNALMQRGLGEEELARLVLGDFGAYYDPRVTGTRMNDWLRAMRACLPGVTTPNARTIG